MLFTNPQVNNLPTWQIGQVKPLDLKSAQIIYIDKALYACTIENLTCTRFQLCEISATGSVATERSAPINII